MVGDKDDNNPFPPPALPRGGAGNRETYSRLVSQAGVSRLQTTSKSSKSRACLPPISVTRPKAMEWPKAGMDDIGVWPNVTTTPRVDVNSRVEFNKECSRVIDHVFLGSDLVAKNLNVLRNNGITHVLNCVGFVCPEYFKKDLVYKTLWLRDTPTEDITSILYDVFDYFEDVRQQNGRIFVHCCKGVSRSTSLVIAYIMWINQLSFEEAFQKVKIARGVIDPNMGFACQLLTCQKRVHAGHMSPGTVLRMFRIAPHSSYDPLHLVPKLVTQPGSNALDSRGAFIFHLPDNIYVWIGTKCVLLMSEAAVLAASQVIKYEKANGSVLSVAEGEEPIEFCAAVLSEKEPGSGKRRVVDYDLDFEVFDKAVNGGVVPPLAFASSDHEMCLPARRSSWERLKRKFTNGVTDELIDHTRTYDDDYENESSESSSFSVKRFKKVH